MGVASDADGTPGTAPLGLLAVVKGKRSKRHRGYVTVDSPPRVPEVSRSCSDADEVAAGYGTEEEDMAHCLMLLAHGRVGSPETEAAKEDKFRSRRSADGGELVYECKTCNKCFPSFQALGGHRTSHKKPRLRPPPPAAAVQAEEEKPQASTSWTVPSKPVVASDNVNSGNSSKSRTHECSICGAEFASGQALGGHMRRHRPLVQSSERKEKVLLELDLNLPASCEGGGGDVMASSFVFDAAAEMERLFPAPASALVDCHY